MGSLPFPFGTRKIFSYDKFDSFSIGRKRSRRRVEEQEKDLVNDHSRRWKSRDFEQEYFSLLEPEPIKTAFLGTHGHTYAHICHTRVRTQSTLLETVNRLMTFASGSFKLSFNLQSSFCLDFGSRITLEMVYGGCLGCHLSLASLEIRLRENFIYKRKSSI